MLKIDRTGMRYGQLVVVDVLASVNSCKRVLCLCDCGNYRSVFVSNLTQGTAVNCGCTLAVNKSLPKIKHGQAGGSGKTMSKEYACWCNARSRCFNPNMNGYENYGGRGITMCEEWRHSFEAFFAYVGPKPSPMHSIDRIDNDGNYEPGNVRWATASEQINNRRKRKRQS